MASLATKEKLLDAGHSLFSLLPTDKSAATEFVRSGKLALDVAKVAASLQTLGLGALHHTEYGDTFVHNIFSGFRSVKDRYKDDVARDVLKVVMEFEASATSSSSSTHSAVLLLKNSDGRTPLFVAAGNADVSLETIELLLEYQPLAVSVRDNNIRLDTKLSTVSETHAGLYPIHAALKRSQNKEIPADPIVDLLLLSHPDPECAVVRRVDDDAGYRAARPPRDVFRCTLFQSLFCLDETDKWRYGTEGPLERFLERVSALYNVGLVRSEGEMRCIIREKVAEEYKASRIPFKWFRSFAEVQIPEFEPKMSVGEKGGGAQLLSWPDLTCLEDSEVARCVGPTAMHALLSHIPSESVHNLRDIVAKLLKFEEFEQNLVVKDAAGQLPLDILADRAEDLATSDYKKECLAGAASLILHHMPEKWLEGISAEQTSILKGLLRKNDEAMAKLCSSVQGRYNVVNRLWRPKSAFGEKLEGVLAVGALALVIGVLYGGATVVQYAVSLLGRIVTLATSSESSFDANMYSGGFFLASVGFAALLRYLYPKERASRHADALRDTSRQAMVASLPFINDPAVLSYTDADVWKNTSDPLYVSLRTKEAERKERKAARKENGEEEEEEEEKERELTLRAGALTPFPGTKVLVSPVTQTPCLAYAVYLSATYEEKNHEGKWVRRSSSVADTFKQVPLTVQGVLLEGRISLDGCLTHRADADPETLDPQDWYVSVTDTHESTYDCFKSIALAPWTNSMSCLQSSSFKKVFPKNSRAHSAQVREFCLKPEARCAILGFAEWNGRWNCPEVSLKMYKDEKKWGRVSIRTEQSKEEDGETTTTSDSTAVAQIRAHYAKLKKSADRMVAAVPYMGAAGAAVSLGFLVLSFKHSFE